MGVCSLIPPPPLAVGSLSENIPKNTVSILISKVFHLSTIPFLLIIQEPRGLLLKIILYDKPLILLCDEEPSIEQEQSATVPASYPLPQLFYMAVASSKTSHSQ